MGWSGYSLYSGDGTQTLHIDFIKTAIPSLSEDDIFEFMQLKKTKIPKDLLLKFKKGIPSILKKIKVPKSTAFTTSWDEDIAIEWQMLLSLIVDNDLQVPNKILIYGILASYYLLGEHCDDFTEPSKRRAAIKRFIKKVDSEFCNVTARKKIQRYLDKKA